MPRISKRKPDASAETVGAGGEDSIAASVKRRRVSGMATGTPALIGVVAGSTLPDKTGEDGVEVEKSDDGQEAEGQENGEMADMPGLSGKSVEQPAEKTKKSKKGENVQGGRAARDIQKDKSSLPGHDTQAPDQAQKQAAHVRFGSEEPAVPPSATAVTTVEHSNEDDASDSDSDAPEAVTTSAALQQVKDTAKEARRAASALNATTKQSRRARTLQLQEQAQAARNRNAPAAGPDEDTAAANDAPTTTRKRARALPDLLPESILAAAAAAPARRSPSPAPASRGKHTILSDTATAETAASRARERERAEARARRERRAGPLWVKVLEGRNGRMAERVNKDSKGVKDAWLRGRAVRGGKGRGEGGVERVAWSGGFVRR